MENSETELTRAPGTLTDEERQTVPGWLVRLVDAGDVYELNYAARHCADRYNVRLLSRVADELSQARA